MVFTVIVDVESSIFLQKSCTMKNATIHAILISSISNSRNLRLYVNYSLRATDTTLSSEAGNSADSVSDDEISLLDSLPLEDPWSAQVPNWLSVTSL